MPNNRGILSSISNDFRENLLNRNIISKIIDKGNLSALLNNIGNFTSVSSTPNYVRSSEDIETLGSLFRIDNVKKNKIQPEDYHYSNTNISSPTQFNEIEGIYSIDSAKLSDSDDQQVIRDLNLINNIFISDNPSLDLKSITDVVKPTSQVGEYGYNKSKLIDEAGDSREKNSILNKYYDTQQQIVSSISVLNAEPTTQFTNYIDRLNNMKSIGLGLSPSNVLNNLLGGVTPNTIGTPSPFFDIQSVLRGRDLTSETELGIIGNEQLGYHLQQNIAFNTRRETLGRLNTNPTNIVMGQPLIQPDYTITVSKDGGQILSYAQRILGVTIPVSFISSDASIFTEDVGNVGNVTRTNSLLGNTGNGQIEALLYNISRNEYAPGYINPKDIDKSPIPYLYAYYTGEGDVQSINDFIIGGRLVTVDKWDKTQDFPELSNIKSRLDTGNPLDVTASSDDIGFTYSNPENPTSDTVDVKGYKKSIISKTKELFNIGKIETLLTSRSQISKNDDISSNVNGYTSKGSGVVKFNGVSQESNPQEMFSRTYDVFKQYDRVSRLQKKSGILPNGGINERRNHLWSVLDDNGFIKMAPYKGALVDDITKIKKYMFSIENLAWADDLSMLSEEEQGNGDPDATNPIKGRIMWFPPYDISFTDNTSVDWEKTNFIGRGEPVLTYNNTIRTGNLQFKIIIDHPSYLNGDGVKTLDNITLTSLLSGEADIDEFAFTENEKVAVDLENQVKQDENPTSPPQQPKRFCIFFPPFSSNMNYITDTDGYESGTNPSNTFDYTFDSGLTGPNSPSQSGGGNTFVTDSNSLNRSFIDRMSTLANDIDTLKENNWPYLLKVEVENSEDGSLSNKRITAVENYLSSNFGAQFFLPKRGGVLKVDKNSTLEDYKQLSRVCVTFERNITSIINKPAPKIKTQQIKKTIAKKRRYEEKSFFDKLGQNDKFIYDKISDSIKHFHPAFHSITPEGFNSRLNFLHQCTRQGPTKDRTSIDGKRPDNLAFGRPPICILRIGDFYHTKIAIDTMNMSFDPLVWDMNPEGIGVQPMICTVDLNFTFIGGSSLQGPISRLNNAVSFEFFANTQIYDDRAYTWKEGKLQRDYDNQEDIGSTVDSLTESQPPIDQVAVAEAEVNTSAASSTQQSKNPNEIDIISLDNNTNIGIIELIKNQTSKTAKGTITFQSAQVSLEITDNSDDKALVELLLESFNDALFTQGGIRSKVKIKGYGLEFIFN